MQKKNKFQLILGSQSPRRKELLQWLFIPYQIITSQLEEVTDKTSVEDIVQDLAHLKAQDVYNKAKEKYASPFVIGADTIVVLENEILGKPKDKEHARQMLLKLQNKSHRVLTGVCFVWEGKTHRFYDETKVFFDKITPDLLEFYLNTNESLDKAGAYGIQGAALSFIGRIEGSYSNVVGLPINLVLDNMKKVLDLNSEFNWRDLFEV